MKFMRLLAGTCPHANPQEDEPCLLAKDKFGLCYVVGSLRNSKHIDF